MGNKDIITKDILKNIAKELSRHILKIEIDDNIELIDKEFTRVEKREADLLFKSAKDIIHIEIQNNNHKKMHQRMLRYYSDIYFEYNNEYSIKQYMIYIGKENCSMVSKIKRDKIDYEYGIIDMKNISCREFLQSSDPSAVALAILCDFEGEEKQLVVNTILKKLKLLSSDEIEFRSNLKMVEILSTNRNLEENVKRGEEMLVVDIEKMPSFNIGLERGIETGIQQGIQQGIQKGIEQSMKFTATQMLKFNLDVDIISKSTGLTKEEILSIEKEMNSQK